jgi:broad specificity phosphatase PhoE
MTRLILIRHGETDWNVEGRWQGHADVPLNPRGHRQAEEIARTLSGTRLDALYTSDLERTLQTAAPLARNQQLQIKIDPRLREIDQGEWQGLLVSEIQIRYAKEFRQRRENPLEVAPPGGETALQVRERVLAAVQDILDAHPGQTVALISHGFALAVIRAYFQDIPIGKVWDLVPGNGEIVELEIG